MYIFSQNFRYRVKVDFNANCNNYDEDMRYFVHYRLDIVKRLPGKFYLFKFVISTKNYFESWNFFIQIFFYG